MPFGYDLREKIMMVESYLLADKDTQAAMRLYQGAMGPGHYVPDARTFVSWYNKFHTWGNLDNRPERNQVVQEWDSDDEDTLARFAWDPHASSRGVGAEKGVSHTKILNSLHKFKFHPYHMVLNQALEPDDFAQRVAYATSTLARDAVDANYLPHKMYTDECLFKNNAHVNRHNMRFWSDVNPRWMRDFQGQRKWSVMVWGGIINDRLIGPHFFDESLDSDVYIDFLQRHLPGYLSTLPLQVRRHLTFMQDGAPPHWAVEVRDLLDQMFPNNWIGRDGPMIWPPRSPDITPCDFFLWGAVKDKVYKTMPTTPEDMKDRIRRAFQEIQESPAMHRWMDAMRKRLQVLIEVDGATFEHLIN